jgi:hypothetical protein
MEADNTHKDKNDIKVCYGIDVYATAGWLVSYGGKSSCDISRGFMRQEKVFLSF